MSAVAAQPRTTHRLKTWPVYFEAVADGRKTYEVRFNDRGFQAGDLVVLVEYDPQPHCYCSPRQEHFRTCVRFTGRTVTATIGFVLDAIPNGGPGRRDGLLHMLEGYVVFSLLNVVKP